MVRFLTVAVPTLVIVPVFCSTYMGVMALNNTAHIGHAIVADFNHAPIKYFT